MKKFLCLICTLLVGLSGCTAKDESVIAEETTNKLTEQYEADKTNLDAAHDLIDNLLLTGNKTKAYEVLCEASTYVTTEEDLDKLKEFTEYLPIRLIETDTYENSDEMTGVSYRRYDENGRIIFDNDTTYIYPDDGGDIYYYTLSSWYDWKTCYDLNGNIILNLYDSEYYKEQDQNFIPYDEEYDVGEEYTYEYDDNGNIIKETFVKKTGSSVLKSSTYESEYDDRGNLIYSTVPKGIMATEGAYRTYCYDDDDNMIECQYIDDYNIHTYEYSYDDHGNVVQEIYTYESKEDESYNSTHTNTYQNVYDDFANLIEKTETINNRESNNITTTKYEYNILYGVVTREERIYSNNYKEIKEYIYEMESSDGIGTGLISKDAIAFVSGDATKAVTQRKVVATNIKVRSEPTVTKENKVKLISKDDVVDVYDSVYGNGYIWYEIGRNEWIADDGTWTVEE